MKSDAQVKAYRDAYAVEREFTKELTEAKESLAELQRIIPGLESSLKEAEDERQRVGHDLLSFLLNDVTP